MKAVYRFFILLFVIFLSGTHLALSQVTVTNPTNTTPNLAATYTSLANAITALNSITAISGPVIITLNAGNPQTAPVGGYAINFTATTTASNNIVITGSGNTITSNSSLTAGIYTDAIFKLIGVDFVTLQNFVMQENSLNTTLTPASNNMTEWGVALLHSSTTNGAQNNTIQNNTISLNRSYQNSFGIYSNARHSATAVSTAEDVTNATTGPNHGNKIYGNAISNVNHGIVVVGSSTDANMDLGNEIGGSTPATGNTLTSWGSTTIASPTFFSASGTIFGIYNNHQKNDRIAYNTVNSGSILGTASTTFRGIYKRYSNGLPTGTFTSNIVNNSITLAHTSSTSGSCVGIDNADLSTAAASATINITDNQLINFSLASATGTFVGISSTDQVGVLNISNNIIRGISMSGTGSYTAISNTGAVVTTLNINNNIMGDASADAVTFTASTGNAVAGITVPTVASTASVSISGNSFRGFVHNNVAGGAANHVYISLIHSASGASTDNINNNTFNNLSVKSTGSVTFISRSGAMASGAGATENCSNNSIVGGFSKTLAGGALTLYSGTSASLVGNSMVQTGNNFSNINLTGATSMNGWNNAEGSTSLEGPQKTITNNTFSNWTCGSGAVTVLTVNNSGSSTLVSGNSISSISATASTANPAITGILVGSGNRGTVQTFSNNSVIGLSNTATTVGAVLGITGGSANVTTLNITGNIVGDISSVAGAAISGIRVSNGLTTHVSKNKIYNLVSNNVGTTAVVSGFEWTSTTASSTMNLSNNTIGMLSAPNTDGINVARGINFTTVTGTSTYNIFYNTVYLNANTTAANSGSSALHLTVSGTSTSGTGVVRNNIFINLSTPAGIGITAAYRRNGPTLTNFSSSSNNNIYYAGTPSASRLIFYDGTNSDQTLANYKSRVTPRDAASFTELTPFISTTGSAGNFLHIDPAVPTQAESGAVNISGFTDDFDGDIRQGNVGYTGTGTAPDIGADELEGTFTEVNPPVISYTALTSFTCSSGNQTLSGVNITDVLGVPLSGSNRPRIYYRKNSGSWFSQPGTYVSGTASNSNWTFTIVVSDMGGVTGGDVVSYYVIAQDVAVTPNVGSNPSTGLVASSVNAVTTHPTSPNTYTLNYTLNGTYTVGSGGNFATLTAAISAYNNACNLTGPVVFELIDNSYQAPAETFPLTINNHAAASAINTLTIRPSATASPSITGNTTTQTINLNGARFIRFDGRQGGVGTTQVMTITGSSTAITVNFTNDAQNNTVNYCVIKGQRVSAFSGTIVFATAGAGTGNDNNTISNNIIVQAGGFSNNAIYSNGTSGKGNDFNTISNNLIANYYNATANSAGIYVVANSSDWTITGNRFYQEATRQYLAACDQFGIYITSGTGYTIQDNVIGFADASENGLMSMYGSDAVIMGFPTSFTPAGTSQSIRFFGIYLSLGTVGSASQVNGNTVGGIAYYTGSTSVAGPGVFSGITVESGQVNIGNLSGNVVGSMSNTRSIYVLSTANVISNVFGIRAVCSGTSLIQNNTIGGFAVSGSSSINLPPAFTCLHAGGAASYTISSNSIGNESSENLVSGYLLSGGFLSNTGTITAAPNSNVSAFTGIASVGTGISQVINSNLLQGWATGYNNIITNGISTTGTLPTSGSSFQIASNQFGTQTNPWLNTYNNNSSSVEVTGIAYANSNVQTANIETNSFSQVIGTPTAGASILTLIQNVSSNISVSNLVLNIRNNILGGINTAAAGTFYGIYNAPISSIGIINIEENKTDGNSNTTLINVLNWIYTFTFGNGIEVRIYDNNISNVQYSNSSVQSIKGIYCISSSSTIKPVIRKNTISTWNSVNGIFNGIHAFGFVGTLTIDSNTVSNIQCQAASAIGIQSNRSASVFNAVHNIRANTIQSISSTGSGGSSTGIFVSLSGLSSASDQVNIEQNGIRALTVNNSFGSGYARGILLSGGFQSTSTYNIRKNKITALQSQDNFSEVHGIFQGSTTKGTVNYSNNYIGDLHAQNYTGTNRAVAGMYLGGTSVSDNLYYNTIHLNTNGGSSNFSTTCMYAETTPVLTLRNNIISNTSVPGSSGKTVAFGLNGSSLTNYSAASNNNLFYAGTASSQRLLFFDNTSGDQTLVNFQARVTPRDNLSVSVLPQFISTNSADASFLHLSTSGNCSLLGVGDNTGILLADDYDGDARNTSFPFITDIGADEATKFTSWTGANGTSWNDPGNWSNGLVPNSTEFFVTIANPPVVQPLINTGETFQVGNIYISPEGTLSNRGTLKISGRQIATLECIDNTQAGVISGSVEYNGSCGTAQTISGSVFKLNAVKNLTVSNDLIIDATAGEEVKVAGALSFGTVSGKTLTTGDNVVLLSSSTATAGLGDVTGNSIAGKMTVERFINTGTTGGAHPKSWQFLSAPTIGQSIFDSWQEAGSNSPGYGTWITGTGTGFDASSVLPSLKYYNPATNLWDGETNTANPVNNGKGYMLFVRGDRTVTTFNGTPVPTILRSKGTVYQPSNPPPAVAVGAGQSVSVGNPYPSAIDIAYMRDNSLFVNLNNDVVVWDPMMSGTFGFGGYQTLAAANNYEPTAGGTSYYPSGVPSPTIQSGQAFFVRSSGSAGSVNFNEACKETGSRLVHRPRPLNRSYFRVTLRNPDGSIADGNAVVFDQAFSNRINSDDAVKMLNNGENFGLARAGKWLAVEARGNIQRNDTIFYESYRLRRQPYVLAFAPKNIVQPTLEAVLIDRFLRTETIISLTDSSFVGFTITDNPSSSRPDRFLVVFRKKERMPQPPGDVMLSRNSQLMDEKEPSVSVYPNPVVNGNTTLYTKNLKPGRYILRVMDLEGREVSRQALHLNSPACTENVSLGNHLSAGLYQLTLNGLDAAFSLRIIIP